MECLAVELVLDLVSWLFSNARGGVKISFLMIILTAESALVPTSLNRFYKAGMSSSASSPSLTMVDLVVVGGRYNLSKDITLLCLKLQKLIAKTLENSGHDFTCANIA